MGRDDNLEASSDNESNLLNVECVVTAGAGDTPDAAGLGDGALAGFVKASKESPLTFFWNSQQTAPIVKSDRHRPRNQ